MTYSEWVEQQFFVNFMDNLRHPLLILNRKKVVLTAHGFVPRAGKSVGLSR